MYPIYPNSFDQLTTNGIIGEDLMNYVTGTPSPYLQNYIARRGGIPSLPGQMMPDGMPNLPNRYQPMQDRFDNSPVYPMPQKDKNPMWKKIAAAVLVGGLATLGIWKGGKLIGKLKKPAKPPTTPAPAAPAAGTPWYKKVGNWFKNLFS